MSSLDVGGRHQKREILFVVTEERYHQESGKLPPAGRKLLRTHVVNLGDLSPAAYRVAAGITTTDPSNELSQVRILSHKDNEGVIRDRWKQVSSTVPEMTLAQYLKKIAKANGPTYLRQHPVILWKWRPLDTGESPEEYLETQIREMTSLGEIEHVALEPDGISADHASKRLGVSDTLIRRWCRDGRIPGATKRGGRDWWIPPAGLQAIFVYPRSGRPRSESYEEPAPGSEAGDS